MTWPIWRETTGMQSRFLLEESVQGVHIWMGKLLKVACGNVNGETYRFEWFFFSIFMNEFCENRSVFGLGRHKC